MRLRELKLTLSVLCCAAICGCAQYKQNHNGGQFGVNAEKRSSLLDRFKTHRGDGSAPTNIADQQQLPKTRREAEAKTFESDFAMARLHERRGENEEAERAYRSLLAKTPRDSRLHHRLGVLAIKRGELSQAEQHLIAARSLSPTNAELLSDIGYCYYLQQRLPEAETTLREALKLQPTYTTAMNNLALVVGRQGRAAEALELFKRSNNEAESYANLAYVMSQNGDMDGAKQTYLRALTLNNTMRVAAQAMLQVDERAKAQSKLAATKPAAEPSEPNNAAPDATTPVVQTPVARTQPQTKPAVAPVKEQPEQSISERAEKIVLMLPPPPASTNNLKLEEPAPREPQQMAAQPQPVEPELTRVSEPVQSQPIENPVAQTTEPAVQEPSSQLSGFLQNMGRPVVPQPSEAEQATAQIAVEQTPAPISPEQVQAQSEPAQLPQPVAAEAEPVQPPQAAESNAIARQPETSSQEVIIESHNRLDDALSQATKALNGSAVQPASAMPIASEPNQGAMQTTSMLQVGGGQQQVVIPGANAQPPQSVLNEQEIVVESYRQPEDVSIPPADGNGSY